MNDMIAPSQLADPLPHFLDSFSVEVVSNDTVSIALAGRLLKPGTEVFIANLPKHKTERQIDAAVALRESGLVPVPHIVARNLADRVELEALLRNLHRQAGVDTALILGGDRDHSLGAFDDSLQLLETGLLEQYGVCNIYVAAYPEGHKRISHERLVDALSGKLSAAADRGIAVTLVSQFCFDAKPIVAWAQALRDAHIHVPYRVGVAGPASKTALLKFALLCGVGPSLRALKERENMARNMLAAETPEALLREVASAQIAQPGLNITGAHFFTFGALAKTADWIASQRDAALV